MSHHELQNKPRSRPRGWFRFSLRTLLIVMTVCCVILAQWVNQLVRQRTAVKHFYELTAKRPKRNFVTMGYRYQGEDNYYKPLAYKWLHPLIGEEAFGEVIMVQLTGTPTTDEDLRYLGDLSTVETVRLSFTQVTDQGLRHLLSCPKLRSLELGSLPITDDGLAQLVALTNLEEISLSQTKITDDSLEHLAKLPKLKCIWLRGTAISDSGYNRLKAALPSCEIQADVPAYFQNQRQSWPRY